MKRYRAAVALTAALAAVFLLLGALASGRRSAAAEEGMALSLRSEGGVVAVYSGGEKVAETEISLSGLRDADRALVEGGVAVEDYEELVRLIEDLNS